MSKRLLFLDIETLRDPRGPAPYIAEAEPDGRVKDPVKMALSKQEKGIKAWERTSLHPLHGWICVIGVACDDWPAKTLIGMNEEAVLRQLDELVDPDTTLVAFNGLGFDFKYVAVRAMKYGLHGLTRAMRCPRYGDERHIDPFQSVFPGYPTEGAGLSDFARHFGIKHNDQISGSQVYEVWQRNPMLVAEHARLDVELLRTVCFKMVNGGWRLW